VEADRLKDGFDFVVAIIALAQDVQAPVDFRKSWNAYS
jgi:hypothetical protein